MSKKKKLILVLVILLAFAGIIVGAIASAIASAREQERLYIENHNNIMDNWILDDFSRALGLVNIEINRYPDSSPINLDIDMLNHVTPITPLLLDNLNRVARDRDDISWEEFLENPRIAFDMFRPYSQGGLSSSAMRELGILNSYIHYRDNNPELLPQGGDLDE